MSTLDLRRLADDPDYADDLVAHWAAQKETLMNQTAPINWRRIERPKTWRPAAGTTLVGYYIGKSVRDGKHGQYEVVIIGVPVGDGFSRPHMISGTQIVQAIDAGNVQPGNLVRVTFEGMQELKRKRDDGTPFEMKVFVVDVAEGSLSVEETAAYIRELNGEIEVEEDTPRQYDNDVFHDKVLAYCVAALERARRENPDALQGDVVKTSLLNAAKAEMQGQIDAGEVVVTEEQRAMLPGIVDNALLATNPLGGRML